MRTDLLDRICLGTAQFGLDYGIANARGKVSFDEVGQILRCALENGIVTLDTAGAYGDSEQMVGAFLKNDFHQFCVINGILKTVGE